MRKEPAPVEPALKGATLAVVLGSGLGGVGDAFPLETRRKFDDIPGLEAAGVEGHAGELKLCRLQERRCLFVCGRPHFYEGCSTQISVLIEFLYALGIRRLLLTSAAGSLSTACQPGGLLLTDTVLDLQFRPVTPGSGRQRGSMPPRDERQRTDLRSARPVPDRAVPERRPGLSLGPGAGTALHGAVVRAAKRARVRLARGTVVCTAGPAYETRSEVEFLQRLGISAASMSGAPEIAAARGLGIQIASLTLLTNWATGISSKPLRHADVLDGGRRAADDLRRLIAQLVGGG